MVVMEEVVEAVKAEADLMVKMVAAVFQLVLVVREMQVAVEVKEVVEAKVGLVRMVEVVHFHYL